MRNHHPVLPAVDLALQGGGSHGAFTWGVLDRLLEPDGLSFAAISGTSAGALNAAVLVSGFHTGGRDGARAALTEFWHDVSGSGTIFSPYEFNPLNLNPLRDVLKRHVDVQALHACSLHLFVTATSVETGQAKVFTGNELSIDALLASACLPFIFQAVEIDGHAYWDGGYTGNPAIYPLIYQSEVLDILLVKINPLSRPQKPTRSVEIIDRLSEITFNASLVSEMRAIAFVSRLVREGKLDPGRYKDLRLHMVADDDGLAPFNASSKFNTDRAFLDELFALGRAAAHKWLKQHRDAVGVRQTLDLERVFLGPPRRVRAVGAEATAPTPAATHAKADAKRPTLWQRSSAWLARRRDERRDKRG